MRQFVFTIRLCICFSTILLPSIVHAETHNVPGGWIVGPVSIDGRVDDWDDFRGINLTEQQVSMSIRNDSTFLYLLFRTRDVRWVRTIKMSGLTIYCNEKGKTKKDFFIRYKGGPSREEMAALGGPSNNADQGASEMGRQFRGMMEDTLESLVCNIKDYVLEKNIPLNGNSGPAAAFDTSQGFFLYEFRIPLMESSPTYYGIPATFGKEVAIGFEWGGMGDFKRPMRGGDRPEGMDGPDGMGGGPGGMGGGPGGMGGSGGMSGPPGGMGGPGRGRARPEMPQKQEVWLKVQLLAAPSK